MGEENMTKTKKEAMDQVEANALMSWKIAAQNAIRDLAGNNKEFVADDVWGLNHQRPVVIWKSHIYRAKPVPKATVTVKRGGFLSWVKAIFTGRDRVIA